MLGNRVPGLNKPTALPTEVLGMAPKSHLTVKHIAKDPVHRRGESQSLGSNHRRYTSYSTLTSPSLSAYEGENGTELPEVDEFGGLSGLDRPQTAFSLYSPVSTPQSLPSPEDNAVDRFPGKITIPDKFQRRVVSDFHANYGITRALTPDPEVPLQQLDEEEAPLSLEDCGSPRPEAESLPDPEISDDVEEPEIQLPEQPSDFQPSTEPTPQFQTPAPDAYPHPPADSVQEATTEPVPESISEPVLVVDVVEEDAVEDTQLSADVDALTRDQEYDPVPEVSEPNPISISPSYAIDIVDASPSPLDSTPPTPTSAASALPNIENVEQPTPEPTDDVPSHEETPIPPTFAFQPPSVNSYSVEGAPSELQTPPESPRPASSNSTSTSDLSDVGVDYQSGSNHLDPDDDLFVLPLPKDNELPIRPIAKEVAVSQSMYQVVVPPPPTLHPPIDFPIMTSGNAPTASPDPNISLTGDESLALDASQAEIVIAQSEVISPASPTLVVAMPSPSPTTTAFRVQTPPLSEGSPPSPDQVDDTQVSPPRIRKKLYTNHTAPTSFKDTLSPPPSRQSFSAVVHPRAKTPTSVPDRVDSVTPKPSMLAIMTPKKQSLFAEPMTPASPGSELAFLAQNAAILEAQLSHGGDFGGEGSNKPGPARQAVPLVTEPLRSSLRSGIGKVKSASTPTLVPSSATTSGSIPPVPDLVYDDGSSNSGLSLAPQIPPFLPQFRSRKSGAHEDPDRKSLAPSHKSRKSEKSVKEKDKGSMPRARKLSSRLRSLASASTNSLRSLGRPSVSSDTSVSFDSPTTVSIEPMTPQDTGSGDSGRFGSGIGSPGGRSQTSQGSGSEWGSPPRKRDVLGRASSFADRFISRVGKTKSGFLDNSQGTDVTCCTLNQWLTFPFTGLVSGDYLSPTRANTVSGRKPSRESHRGTNEKYGTPISQSTSPPRVEIPFLRNEDTTKTPPNNPTYLRTLPSIPLTPSTPDSSSFFDSTELFDAFPSVPQNLPNGPGSSLLSGFEPRTNSGPAKAATMSSSYRPRASQSYR